MSSSPTPNPPEDAPVDNLQDPMQRLFAFEPTTLPVISLYLNTQSNDRGRDEFGLFLRQELLTGEPAFAPGSPERASFDADVEKITKYTENSLKPAANGLAIFACSGADLFEAVQLNVPIDEHKLYIYNQPHLYHLARLDDEYPRYAAVVLDSNSARIFVFGLGQTVETEEISGKKMNRVKVGGWSQARYQRRVQNALNAHAKELVDSLEKLVQKEGIKHIIISGDVASTTALQELMPKQMTELVVDVLRLNVKASDKEIFDATLKSMQQLDEQTDADRVAYMYDQARARGLAVLGVKRTLEALTNGQVDELLISTSLEEKHATEEKINAVIAPEIPDSQGGTDSEEPRKALLADLLVTKAKQTDARVTFIEDSALMDNAKGVGAILRWRA